MRIKRNQLQKIIRQELETLYTLNERSPDQTLPPPVKPEKSQPTLEEMGVDPNANSLVRGSQVLNHVGMDVYKQILPSATELGKLEGSSQVAASVGTKNVVKILSNVTERAKSLPEDKKVELDSVEDLVTSGLMSQQEVDNLREKFAASAVRGLIEGVATSANMSIPTTGDYILRALTSAAKMNIFGIFDNLIMILAGEAIATVTAGRIIFGVAFVGAMNEGVGNAISDAMAEWFSMPIINALGLDPEKYVTDAQMRDAPAYWQTIDEGASIVGVFIGCIIGLAPLFFMKTYKAEAAAAATMAARKAAIKKMEQQLIRMGHRVAATEAASGSLGARAAALSGPVMVGLLIGGIIYFGLDTVGEYKLDKADNARTLKAFNNALSRVLIKSGVMSAGKDEKGETVWTVEKEFAPYFGPLLTKSLDETQKQAAFNYLRKTIDRDVFESEMNPEAFVNDPHIKVNIFTSWLRELMTNLGYLTLESNRLKISGDNLKKIIQEELSILLKESREDRMRRVSSIYEPQRRAREQELKKTYRRRPGRNKSVSLTIVTKDQATSDEEALKVAMKRLNPDNIYPYGDFDYVGYDADDDLHVISYSIDEF